MNQDLVNENRQPFTTSYLKIDRWTAFRTFTDNKSSHCDQFQAADLSDYHAKKHFFFLDYYISVLIA